MRMAPLVGDGPETAAVAFRSGFCQLAGALADRERSSMSEPELAFDVERLVALGRVSQIVPAPCGRWAVVVVQRLDRDESRYVSNLWRVELVGEAPPLALTTGDHRDRAPGFRADGALAFLSDRPVPGDDAEGKRSQVWLLPARGGEPRPLTDEPLGVSDFRFASSGDRLVVLADVLPDVPHEEQRALAAERSRHGPSVLRYTRMPVRYWDRWLPPQQPHLIAYDGDGQDRRDLTPDANDALLELTWDLSPDGALVAASWATMNPGDRIFDRPLAVIDTHHGHRRLLGLASGVVHASPRFSPDGGRIAVARYTRTPDGYGARTLWTYELASPDGSPRELTGRWDRWPAPWGWTADGRRVLCTADDEGTHPVFAVDAETGAASRLVPAGGAYESLVPVPGRDEAVAIRHTTLEPPEPWRLPLSGDAPPRRIASLSGLEDGVAERVATTRSVRSEIGPGRMVQAYIVEPTEAPARGPRKTLLWIHGGPVSAWNDQWHWRWNALVMAAQGWTVVLPNPAGSTGFGLEWVNDIWGNVWGARCYDDLMGLVDILEREDGLRAADMVAMGGSFGGYMTNWIGANTTRFRALVTHASLYDLGTFHGVTDVPAWWSLMMEASPYDDPDAFRRYSPSRLVKAWRTPTLILHGDKDYRVPIGEALQLFEALDLHGVPAELAVFPDEHHHILKPRNIVAWYHAVADFLARHWHREDPAR